MISGPPLLVFAITTVFTMLSVALFLAFIRLAQGPSLPDRVVALELITAVAVAFIALYAVAVEQPVFLEAAIALALISFLATVAFARYLERDKSLHE
ncbi:MAG: cation:proton antiporter [Deinococcota bacterium]|jgi:multicomponent Na+:H+ antiporter subunit F|nr:cation:proton antiporter [Deinococcota bacterium]